MRAVLEFDFAVQDKSFTEDLTEQTIVNQNGRQMGKIISM